MPPVNPASGDHARRGQFSRSVLVCMRVCVCRLCVCVCVYATSMTSITSPLCNTISRYQVVFSTLRSNGGLSASIIAPINCVHWLHLRVILWPQSEVEFNVDVAPMSSANELRCQRAPGRITKAPHESRWRSPSLPPPELILLSSSGALPVAQFYPWCSAADRRGACWENEFGRSAAGGRWKRHQLR